MTLLIPRLNPFCTVWRRKQEVPMSDLNRQTPSQRAHYTYMMDVMARLEWDLHHKIEATSRIPEEWHEIAQRTPNRPRLQINLRLDSDVVKFFKSMGAGYGGRINDVLKSYVHARLAGVIKGAETINHFKHSREDFTGAKPSFGDIAAKLGEAWIDAPGKMTGAVAKQQMLEEQARRVVDGEE
jgi:uncharacterized protein (DUF4415 family)